MFRKGCGHGLWMASLLPLAMLNDPLIIVALSTSIYSIFYKLDNDHDSKHKIANITFNSVLILSIMIALLSFSSFVSLIGNGAIFNILIILSYARWRFNF